MALYNIASDRCTRQIIWVSTNVIKGRPQLNSHRNDNAGRSLAKEGIDGFTSVELAGLHTSH